MALARTSVAIVHPAMARGGSEAAVMWGAQALKRDFDVSILTTGKIDLASLNRFYGTNLAPDEVRLQSLPTPFYLPFFRGGDALRGALFERAVRAVAAEYDVLISGYNLCDFGVPAIHTIADFPWGTDRGSNFGETPPGLRGMFHRARWLRGRYLRACEKIAPPSGRNMFSGEDMVLANSRWTAGKLRQRFGVACRVLYAPVAGDFPDVPYQARHDDFVCIGRMSPEKRIERMVRIVGAVRDLGHDVRLRIIGPIDSSPYSMTIGSLARQHPEWVLLEGQLAGEEKLRILAECRYGIHGRDAEPFGIAVAEMVKAGCVTFAPAEGGPAEILDHEALLYRGDEEAIAKITAVLSDEPLREDLTRHLRRQAGKFSAAKFMSDLRAAVECFIHSREQASPSNRPTLRSIGAES